MRFLIFSITIVAILLLNSCTMQTPQPKIVAGVSYAMAKQRKMQISDLRYDLFFDIPEQKSEDIPASVRIIFRLPEDISPLQIDFKEEANHVNSLEVNGESVAINFEQEHLLLSPTDLQSGWNTVDIKFVAGNLSLNRNDDYLYTLLVPDRARTVFPCFDQPNLKATYKLTLEIPTNWEASANGSLIDETIKETRKTLSYQPTKPISTYLFAFAAGAFKKQQTNRNGRSMTMLYRESDTAKVNRNAAEIFDLHAQALSWLEEYTGISYPFEKFDFVLIPTFQYGGMEHVGNIFYREGSLMLDEGATINRKLGRASLIAHETAHMWFGDLVTMDWFNDVWLKEVFANFMAAKIVNPGFPEVNHDLRFLLAHHPSAYSEDRSEGSHPIQQDLENLQEAGTLYGRIIYQKAPIVMQQLEELIGKTAFQAGLQTYLQKFSFGNATWDDLINILDEKTEKDLKSWSNIWVKEAQMPIYSTHYQIKDNQIAKLTITQDNSAPSGNNWVQESAISLFYQDSVVKFPVSISPKNNTISAVEGQLTPLAILLGTTPSSYGYFKLDQSSQAYLLANYSAIADSVLRGATSLALYESFLHGSFDRTETYVSGLLDAIEKETETLNRQRLLSQLSTVFWRFLSKKQREAIAPAIENLLWKKVQLAEDASTKRTYFDSYRSMAYSANANNKLLAIYRGNLDISPIVLSEADQVGLAEALALRFPSQALALLDEQESKIKNADRKKRFEFVRPALSPLESERKAFFEKLKQAENRAIEPWAAQGLSYLNHPLRAETAVGFILPSLELLEEIQATGDIFFPRRWVGAALSGHQSPEAAKVVRDFLANRPAYPQRLKNKILMAADLLFRSSEQLQ